MNKVGRDIVPMWTVLAVCAVVVLLIAGAVPAVLRAAPSSGLPPRATPTPGDRDDHRPSTSGAGFIELTVQPAGAGLWAAVQWQDAAGGWNDVEGWSGDVSGGYQSWGVFQSDFNKGPFRWAVLDGPDGKLLKTSGAFNLPGEATKVVRIGITL